MKSISYIIGLSLAAASLMASPDASACAFPDDTGYYSSPFSLEKRLDLSEWGNRTSFDETIEFWRSYTKGNMPAEDIRIFFDNATIDSIPSRRYKFYNYLSARNDRNALDYIGLCLRFEKARKKFGNDSWEYEKPDESALRAMIKQIDNVKTSKAFKPRYSLLKIRIYGALGDNKGVMDEWNRTGKPMKQSALRDRMSGYVGGVLYREGKYAEALDYFCRLDDRTSIQWCIDKLAGARNLATLYDHQPDSPAIPYILQDYVNYLIAAKGSDFDISKDVPDSIYIVYEPGMREIAGKSVYNPVAEINDMSALCHRVLSEGRTSQPQMWATVLGIMQCLDGKSGDGLATMRQAASLKGSPQSADNLERFTLWAFMLCSGKGDNAADADFASALRSFHSKVWKDCYDYATDYNYKEIENWQPIRSCMPDFYFLSDFFTVEAVRHFYSLNQPARAMAVMAMIDDLPLVYYDNRFTTRLRNDIDRLRPLADGKSFLAFAKSEAANPIDQFLKPFAVSHTNLANDAIGTRLMRDGQFAEALPHLSAVDPRWIKTQPISEYLCMIHYDPNYYNFSRYIGASRNYFAYSNDKANFCSEMIQAIEEFKRLTGEDKARKALEIAARYHFGSPSGEGWAISEYGWSIGKPDNEFTEGMLRWLNNVIKISHDYTTIATAQYAILSMPGKDETWGLLTYPIGCIHKDGNKPVYFINEPHDYQRDALAFFGKQWEPEELPEYISHCDVLLSYTAGRFIERPKNSYYY